MTIEQRLRSLREEAGLTQTELAEKLGVSQMWVSYRETGRTRALHPDDLSEWAEACGYSFAWDFIPSGEDSEAMEAAGALLGAWSSMTREERGLVGGLIRLVSERR